MSNETAPAVPAAAHVLLVDDDERLRGLLSRFLSEQGLRVTTAATADDARDKLRFLDFDLMILDVMMPGETGLALTEDLRSERSPTMPIMLLTALGTPEDIVAGFEAGADDYLGKPFDPRVLLARIKAMLRRAAPPPLPVGPLQMGTSLFEAARAELVTPKGRIRLTGAEFALLVAFAARPNEILSRETLAAALEMDDVSERAIDVQVTRLRRKVEPDPREPRFLLTVRGKGYVLKPGL